MKIEKKNKVVLKEEETLFPSSNESKPAVAGAWEASGIVALVMVAIILNWPFNFFPTFLPFQKDFKLGILMILTGIVVITELALVALFSRFLFKVCKGRPLLIVFFSVLGLGLAAGGVYFLYTQTAVSELIGLSRYVFTVVTPSSFAIFTLIFILIHIKDLKPILMLHPLFTLCLMTIATISFLQFSYFSNFSLLDFGYSIFWITVPLLSYIYAPAFLKQVPFYLLGLNLWNTIFNFQVFISSKFFHWDKFLEYCQNGLDLPGLAGNRNWNASMIVYTTPFTIYALWLIYRRYIRLSLKTNILFFTILAPYVALQVLMLKLCEARAAWLAFLGCGAMILFFLISPFLWSGLRWVASRQARLWVMIMVIIAGCVVGGLLLKGKLQGKGEDIVESDIRPHLWESTLNVIKDNPWLGVTRYGFENELSKYRTEGYYLHPNAALRSNHPHNEWLLAAASWGVIGFIAWFILTVYPLIFSISTLHKKKELSFLLFLFGFSVIYFHAQLDLVLYEWPGNYLGLLFLGVLWRTLWPLTEANVAHSIGQGIPHGNLILRTLQLIAIVCLTSYLGVCLYRNWQASIYYSNGNLIETNPTKRSGSSAAEAYARSAEYAPEIAAFYKAGVIALLEMNNPDLCVYYLTQGQKKTLFENFAHIHGFLGMAWARKQNFREALNCFEKETQCYPISICAWYNLMITYNYVGQPHKVEMANAQLEKIMKMKKIDKSDLQAIVQNPEHDLKFRNFWAAKKAAMAALGSPDSAKATP